MSPRFWKDELVSGDDRLVRDMVRKLRQKLLVKKVNFLTKIGDTIEILDHKMERTKWSVQTFVVTK